MILSEGGHHLADLGELGLKYGRNSPRSTPGHPVDGTLRLPRRHFGVGSENTERYPDQADAENHFRPGPTRSASLAKMAKLERSDGRTWHPKVTRSPRWAATPLGERPVGRISITRSGIAALRILLTTRPCPMRAMGAHAGVLCAPTPGSAGYCGEPAELPPRLGWPARSLDACPQRVVGAQPPVRRAGLDPGRSRNRVRNRVPPVRPVGRLALRVVWAVQEQPSGPARRRGWRSGRYTRSRNSPGAAVRRGGRLWQLSWLPTAHTYGERGSGGAATASSGTPAGAERFKRESASACLSPAVAVGRRDVRDRVGRAGTRLFGGPAG